MRLLKTDTKQLQSFEDSDVPLYAILSHTWGSEEVTFLDISAPRCGKNKGWAKIDGACEAASQQGLDYIWIDTCCIDKTSSTELSEAINSMFQWYRAARFCIAHLQDVGIDERTQSFQLTAARWFTRGWTLQELIAPKAITFYSGTWKKVGDKAELKSTISAITGVDESVLLQPDLLSTISVARRMSWASSRRTTRTEDIAYCLMGLFGVNMPLLYGEGANAFIRLQEEIMKLSEDESLFAWDWQPGIRTQTHQSAGILGLSPGYFALSSAVVPYTSKLEPYAMTNRGLRIQIPVLRTESRHNFIGILHCRYQNSLDGTIGVPLQGDGSLSGRFSRDLSRDLVTVPLKEADEAEVRTIYIEKAGKIPKPERLRWCFLRGYSKESGIRFTHAVGSPAKEPGSFHDHRRWLLFPDESQLQWNMEERTMIVEHHEVGYFAALGFSIQPASSSKESCGFVAILELPTYLAARVALLPCPNVESLEAADLLETIKLEHGKCHSSSDTVHTAHGHIQATMQKDIILGEEMFILDIEHNSGQNSARETDEDNLKPLGVPRTVRRAKKFPDKGSSVGLLGRFFADG